MGTPTEEARIEGIKTKLARHEYYGLAVTDITWLLTQVSKYQTWHQESLTVIAEQAELLRAANLKLAEKNRR